MTSFSGSLSAMRRQYIAALTNLHLVSSKVDNCANASTRTLDTVRSGRPSFKFTKRTPAQHQLGNFQSTRVKMMVMMMMMMVMVVMVVMVMVMNDSD